VRILLGLTFLLNGLAKLFGIHRVERSLVMRPISGMLPNWNLSPGA
jgi:hypothetical protein